MRDNSDAIMARKEKNDYLIQSVSLACSLLEQFRGGEQDLSVTDLSRVLHIGKNNVFRLLATLELRNFVEKNPATGAYRLGINNLKLGAACVRSKRFVKEARLPLEAVARESRETAILAVFGKDGLVCEDVVESLLPVRVLVEIGTCLPLHCTAAGKVLLSFGSEHELKPFLDNEPTATGRKTPGTTLQAIRENGYAICLGEYKTDVCGIAAPVRNHAARVIGVVSVACPRYRITFGRLHGEIAPLVVRCAREISERMGYQTAEDKIYERHSTYDMPQTMILGNYSSDEQGRADFCPLPVILSGDTVLPLYM